jgi:hypothetical protein
VEADDAEAAEADDVEAAEADDVEAAEADDAEAAEADDGMSPTVTVASVFPGSCRSGDHSSLNADVWWKTMEG